MGHMLVHRSNHKGSEQLTLTRGWVRLGKDFRIRFWGIKYNSVRAGRGQMKMSVNKNKYMERYVRENVLSSVARTPGASVLFYE